jgi:hypothetical protein
MPTPPPPEFQGPAQFLPFDPATPKPRMAYKDGYQKCYYVLDSFAEGAKSVKAYVAGLGV